MLKRLSIRCADKVNIVSAMCCVSWRHGSTHTSRTTAWQYTASVLFRQEHDKQRKEERRKEEERRNSHSHTVRGPPFFLTLLVTSLSAQTVL